MKNSINILALLILFFSSFVTIFCQTPTKDSGEIISGSNIGYIGGNHLPDDFLSSNNEVLYYKDVLGTPYINNYSGADNNLPIGKVYSKDLKYITTAFIRYNAYTDNMEVSKMEDGVDYYLLKKKENFLYIILKKKTYKAFKYEKGIGYFVILSENDKNQCTLLLKEEINYKRGEKSRSSFLSDTEDRFQKLKDILFIKLNNDVIKLPKKKKDFYNLFGKNKQAIVEYMQSKKLKFNNENDLILIVDYFNTLSN
nr:hypothetical protein [uncultured Psychroserpens sp.]